MLPLVIAGGMLAYAGAKWYQKRHIIKPEVTTALSDNREATETWETLKHENQVATSALTLMLLGRTFFPVLTIPAVLGFSYLTTPLLQRAYKHWQSQQRFDSKLIISLAMPGLLFNGYYLSASLSYWLYSLSRRTQWFNQHIQQLNARPTLCTLRFATQVWVLKGDVEVQIEVHKLQIGQVVRLNGGDIVPADGKVIRGQAVVDELGLGQNQPRVEKRLDSLLLAGSLVESGQVYMQLLRLPRHSFAAQLQHVLNESTAPVLLAQQQQFEHKSPRVDLDMALDRHLALYFASLEQSLLVFSDPRYPDARTLISQDCIQALRACFDAGLRINDGRALAQLALIDKWVIESSNLSKAQAAAWRGIKAYVLPKGRATGKQHGLQACSLAEIQAWRKQGLGVGFFGRNLRVLKQAKLALSPSNASQTVKAQADMLLNPTHNDALKALLKLRQALLQQYLRSGNLQRLPGVSVYGGIFLVNASTVAQTPVHYPENRGWLLQLPMPLDSKLPKKDYLFED